MFSTWDFPDADALAPGAIAIAPRIAALQRRCARAGVPVVFVNDNQGRWRSDSSALLRRCAEGSDTGARSRRSTDAGRRGLHRPQAQAFGILRDATRPPAAALAREPHRYHRRGDRPMHLPDGSGGTYAGLRGRRAGGLRRGADRGTRPRCAPAAEDGTPYRHWRSEDAATCQSVSTSPSPSPPPQDAICAGNCLRPSSMVSSARTST